MRHWHRCLRWKRRGMDCPFAKLDEHPEEDGDEDEEREEPEGQPLEPRGVPVPEKLVPPEKEAKEEVEKPTVIEMAEAIVLELGGEPWWVPDPVPRGTLPLRAAPRVPFPTPPGPGVRAPAPGGAGFNLGPGGGLVGAGVARGAVAEYGGTYGIGPSGRADMTVDPVPAAMQGAINYGVSGLPTAGPLVHRGQASGLLVPKPSSRGALSVVQKGVQREYSAAERERVGAAVVEEATAKAVQETAKPPWWFLPPPPPPPIGPPGRAAPRPKATGIGKPRGAPAGAGFFSNQTQYINELLIGGGGTPFKQSGAQFWH